MTRDLKEVAAVQDAVRAYLELALGLTEASKKKATKIAKKLVAESGAKAGQAQSVAEELITTSLANREAVGKLVRYELDRALGRVGLATAEEVAELTDRVQELERKLRAATASAGSAPASSGAPASTASVAPAASAANGAVAKAAPAAGKAVPAKKAVKKTAAAKKAAATPVSSAAPAAKAPARSAAKTPAKTAAKAPARSAAAAKATPAKKVAKKTVAKKAAPTDV
ncbi:hypothetical protein R8Z50_10360 [Longispora sp. K20-0274]|uniref:hypothetical protein n=1 Tax=Longispora sp. K20-0274 TaxID=3088255 RepID=UPI00399BAEBE